MKFQRFCSFLFAISLTVLPVCEVSGADQPNHRIRKIDTNGVITTVAGSGEPTGFIYQSSLDEQ